MTPEASCKFYCRLFDIVNGNQQLLRYRDERVNPQEFSPRTLNSASEKAAAGDGG